MKRLLCVVGSLDAGGAETFLIKLLREMSGTDYILDFVTARRKKGFYEDEAVSLGSKLYNTALHTEHPIKSFFQLASIVRKNKYKYVFKLSNTPIGVTDLIAAKIGGAKRISVRSCNAILNEGKKSKRINSFLRPIFNFFAKCKIAPSDLAAEYTFGKKKANEVIILHNGVDLNVYKYSATARDRIRAELNITDKTVYGHVGRFSNQKNHLFLLDIFSQIKVKQPNAVLLLVGTGEKLPEITARIAELGLSDSVILTGVRKDIPDILSAMDVFLLPSLYEGMPNTVIEAQATGLPCVISDTITKQANVAGLVKYLPLGDAGIWAETAVSSISPNRKDITKDFITAEYDIKSVCKKFLEITFDTKSSKKDCR